MFKICIFNAFHNLLPNVYRTEAPKSQSSVHNKLATRLLQLQRQQQQKRQLQLQQRQQQATAAIADSNAC